MANYKVNFLQTAVDDLDEIILFIAADSRNMALKWHDELISKLNNLAIFPTMGVLVPDRKISKLGFRMLPVGEYIAFYKIYEDENEITILRVLNAKRDYPRFFENYIL